MLAAPFPEPEVPRACMLAQSAWGLNGLAKNAVCGHRPLLLLQVGRPRLFLLVADIVNVVSRKTSEDALEACASEVVKFCEFCCRALGARHGKSFAAMLQVSLAEHDGNNVA